MSNQAELDKLLQREWRENVIPALGKRPNDLWIPIYQSRKNEGKVSLAIDSVLIPNENVEELLQTADWGRHVHYLQPGFTGGSEDTDPVYHRFVGSEYGIEPLVIQRNFHGLKPDTIEILEEFRLYHNLYEDRQSSKMMKFDAGGNEVDVVRCEDDLVQVTRKDLRQFLAARDLSLLVLYDRRYHVGQRLEVANDARSKFVKTDSFVYRFDVFDSCDFVDGRPETYSRLLGKNVIEGLAREKCGIWPYDDEPIRELEKFIIGVDENEDAILAYSSPYSYGAATNELELPEDYEVPDHLTKVFFDRRVLNKYRNEHTKYTVSDGLLECGSKWHLQLDNNNPKYVIVWLGDLGRDLPSTEHKHWKAHNVHPDGHMSESHIRSQLPSTIEEALNPGEPEDSALRLVRRYQSLSAKWLSAFGWHLFQPLREADSEILETLHIPPTEEVSAFDREMLKLSKLLCDSINVKKIRQAIRNEEPDYDSMDADGHEKKPIIILDDYLTRSEFEQREVLIDYLRMVQDLRSTGSAHRKGNKYSKVAKSVGLDSRPPSEVADEIYGVLADCFRCLCEHFCPDDFDQPAPYRS